MQTYEKGTECMFWSYNCLAGTTLLFVLIEWTLSTINQLQELPEQHLEERVQGQLCLHFSKWDFPPQKFLCQVNTHQRHHRIGVRVFAKLNQLEKQLFTCQRWDYSAITHQKQLRGVLE
uniref:Uncharacterized protein n=1 Tax=Strigamia maritima TaxID=126957 RepID=T1JJS7_STRMM